jgi:sugar phosphate isomerase/epimerase
LKDAGFGGVDLTVRKEGHVLPERAREDLPRAVETLQSHGLQVPMITTELTSPSDPTARPILETAARLKIPFFKLGYWRYGNDVLASLRDAGSDVRGLTDLAKQYGVVAGFHNHPRNVGLAFWDTHEIIRDLDPKWIGYYYDAQNATEEGAIRGWEVGLRLASPRLKMAACKDFYWDRSVGVSKPVECPLGEGVVNWSAVFKLFAAANFAGPISIHQEYTPQDRLAAAHKDLQFVKKQLATARSA